MLLEKLCSPRQGSLVCLLASCAWRSGSNFDLCVPQSCVVYAKICLLKFLVYSIQGLDLHIAEIEELCTEFPNTTVLLDHAGFCKVPEWALLCCSEKLYSLMLFIKNILLIYSGFHQPAEMVRLRILILNSWSSLDSHRWRNWETLVSRFAHISYESEGRVLKQAGICEIQCSIQDIKNWFPLSGPNASPISSCIQFWGKSCHVGQVNFISLHQKKTFIWHDRNMDWVLLMSAAVTSHLWFLNVDTKKPKKLWPLLQNKHPCQVLTWTGSWERRWCSSSLDNGFFLERLHEYELIKQTMEFISSKTLNVY